MLTDDENIVDVQFEVQYRIREGGAAGYVYSNRSPENAVMQVAESAMREAVGSKNIDVILNENRFEIAQSVQKRMQEILDRYRVRRTDIAADAKLDAKDTYFDTGIQITAVAIQNAQPPEQVQGAFDDAVKAGQDNAKQVSEGQAYANDVVPRAKGAAARLLAEAEGYKQRVIATAEGDAARFNSVVKEYSKAPVVMRQRMYTDAMQSVMENNRKVFVDTKSNGNMLYLPLDKLMNQVSAEAAAATNLAAGAAAAANAPSASGSANTGGAASSGAVRRDAKDLRDGR